MCATYGLGGGLEGEEPPLPPMNEKADTHALVSWMTDGGGTAKITGVNARNLNPVLRMHDGAQFELGWWGLWIGGERPKRATFNARDDSLLRSRLWRPAYTRHRALIPATWYVEKSGRFELDGQPFWLAGITTTVRDGDDWLVTYSMVTRDAVGATATVNNRMPLIVSSDVADDWLDPDRPGDEELLAHTLGASHDLSMAVTPTP